MTAEADEPRKRRKYTTAERLAIARWEVRPGSFLTAVWNHHGDVTVPLGPLAPELGRVLHQGGTDVVLVKLAWRVAP